MPNKADTSGRKKWNIIVDFRKLVMTGDSFPIAIITEILAALGKSKYFTIDAEVFRLYGDLNLNMKSFTMRVLTIRPMHSEYMFKLHRRSWR